MTPTNTQTIICKFIRNIEYDFEYPPIVDPFFILRNNENQHEMYNKLTFELLYDLGNIILQSNLLLFWGLVRDL